MATHVRTTGHRGIYDGPCWDGDTIATRLPAGAVLDLADDQTAGILVGMLAADHPSMVIRRKDGQWCIDTTTRCSAWCPTLGEAAARVLLMDWAPPNERRPGTDR